MHMPMPSQRRASFISGLFCFTTIAVLALGTGVLAAAVGLAEWILTYAGAI